MEPTIMESTCNALLAMLLVLPVLHLLQPHVKHAVRLFVDNFMTWIQMELGNANAL